VSRITDDRLAKGIAQHAHLLAFEIERDRRGWRRAGGVAVGRKVAGIEDYEIGLAKAFHLFLDGPDKHVSHVERQILASAAHLKSDRGRKDLQTVK
jgi:hypothetical protein